MGMPQRYKTILTNIAELVEDKEFPARRVLADYAIQLMPLDYQSEATDYMEQEYKRLETA